MKETQPFRELFYRSLKKNFRIMCTAIFLMTLGMLQVYAFDAPPKETDLNKLAQQNVVRGTVTDSQSGQTMPGVNVIIKGTTIGTVTDINGKYSMTVSDPNGVLTFSFIGYQTLEAPVAGRSVVDASLASDVLSLEEVIVVGYGTKAKGQLTGSVANVSGSNLSQIRTADLTKSLQGIMPGVIITDRGGNPGSESVEILVRGTHTLGNNAPLFVIDGVPRSGFGQLSPDDIEDISILKDASAAIYGARAANGVIVIRTKRGKTGESTITINSNYGVNSLTRLPDMMDSWQWAQYQNEVSAYRGTIPMFSEEDIQKYKSGSDPLTHPNTDFYGASFRQYAPQMQHNLSATGGTDKIKYFISGDYLRKESQFASKDGEYDQYQLRSNIDARVHKLLNVGMDLNLRLQNENMPGETAEGVVHRVWFNFPTEHSWYPNGLPYYCREGGANPVVMSSFQSGWIKSTDKIAYTKISFDFDMDWITKGLGLIGYAAYDYTIVNNETHLKPTKLYTYNKNTGEYDMRLGGTSKYTSLAESNSVSSGSLYHIRLAYDRSFGNHTFSAFTAYEQSESEYNYLYAYRQNLFSTSKVELFAGEEDGRSVNGTSSVGGRVNYFGYLSYDYMKKYMLDFTIRRDGSFNFPANKRFGTFPSVSAGWNIAKESFMSGIRGTVDNLKLRISYGEMGNDNIPSYQYLTKYRTGTYFISGESPIYNAGMDISNVPNPNITWEVARMMNVGLDIDLWQGKLSMSFDAFKEKRRGILITRSESVPLYTALELPQENLGKVDNAGVEFQANHRNKVGNVNYNIGGNFTFNRSKIIYMDEPQNVLEWKKKEGHPVNSILAYESDGIFNDAEELASYPHMSGARPGDIKYVDINKDGLINDADVVRHYTSTTPEIQFGLNGGARYRGIEISFLFQGQARATSPLMYNDSGTKPVHLFNERWTEDNPNAEHPRAFGGYDSYQKLATYHFNNAAYLRLKNLELAYDLASANWMPDGAFKQCRIYFRGRNLWTLDYLKDFDPEVPFNASETTRGSRAMYYPQTVTYSVGINITF